MGGCWRLRDMAVKGFRGFVENQDFSFAQPLTLLDGPQGSGKSSTLVAIEWCLFGDEVAKKACGINERKGWLVKNRRADEALVEIVLVNNGDTLKVVRSDKGTRRGTQFYFEFDGHRDESDSKLRRILGIEPKDYFSSVHLHQEVIKALLVEEPRIRKDMVDRLLGLSQLRNMVDAIRAANATNFLNDVDSDLQGIEQTLTAVITAKQQDIEKEKEQGAKGGVSESDFSEAGARRMCNTLKKQFIEFARQAGVSASALPSAHSLDEQHMFIVSARNELRKMRDEQPDLKRQSDLLESKLKLGELKKNYENIVEAIGTTETSLKNIYRVDGKRDQILLRVKNDLKLKLENARDKRARIDKRAGVIDEAMKYFKTIKISAKKESCPVCDKPIDDVKHLQMHLKDISVLLDEELEPVRKEIEKHEDEINRLEGVIRTIDRLNGEIEASHGQLDSLKDQIGDALGRKIKSNEDPPVIVESALKEIGKSLIELESVVKGSNTMLNCIEDDISRLGHVLTVLRLDADIENLLLVRETKEYKEVIKRKSELEDFAGALDVVKQAIQSVLDANARKKLATVKRTISDTFDSLANRPEYSELEIDPDSFEIVAGKGGTKIPALSVLNEGDLNCAGLSVFLGLATTQDLCHNLGFVILDEPSQTLDPSHKENLIKVLNGLPEEKQLLISTSQPDLSELVIKQTPRKKRHYRFAQRSASRGVQLL